MVTELDRLGQLLANDSGAAGPLDAAPFTEFVQLLLREFARLRDLMLPDVAAGSLASSGPPASNSEDISNCVREIRALLNRIADSFHRHSKTILAIDQRRFHLLEIVQSHQFSAARLDGQFLGELNRLLPWLPPLDLREASPSRGCEASAILSPQLRLSIPDFDFSPFAELGIWVRNFASFSTILPSIAPSVVSICAEYPSVMDRSLPLEELKGQLARLVEDCQFPETAESADPALSEIVESQRRSFASFKEGLRSSLVTGLEKWCIFRDGLMANLDQWSLEDEEHGSGF
jgi:hypothetical protein